MTDNFNQIPTDTRFSPRARKVAEFLRGKFYKKQLRIKSKTEEMLRKIGVEHKIILRQPNGTDGIVLEQVLAGLKSKDKIVILTPTFVNPQDAGLLLPDNIMKLANKFILKRKNIETTPQGYVLATYNAVTQRFFQSKQPYLIGILNCNKQDVEHAIRSGGSNCVLVVMGHGKPDIYYTSNGEIIFSEIDAPDEKLKAILKHACHGVDSTNVGRIADVISAWDRGTNPIDFLKNPFAE